MSDMLAMAYIIHYASQTKRRPHEFEHLLVRKSLFERACRQIARTCGKLLREARPAKEAACEAKGQTLSA